ASSSGLMPPSRDGLMLTIRGANGRSSMSAIEWMLASHVMRSRWGSSSSSISGMSLGSSNQASGNASTTRSYSSGSAGTSTTVPEYRPLKSSESTAPVATSPAMMFTSQEGVGSSLKRSVG